MAVAKALVIVMSFLIAVLMGLIIYGFYQKSQNPNYKMFRADDTPVVQADATPPAQPAPQANVGTSFGEVSLDLPATARVISAQANANRLVLVIARNGETADLVAVVDLNSGKVLGRVKTAP
ncbi:hypothetical protein [Magnetovibrio sp.]|uniref:hypothetical protein n=1 Tax=Magnetovibrio sp. TaxID=2024836 RepID=UPI002F95616F